VNPAGAVLRTPARNRLRCHGAATESRESMMQSTRKPRRALGRLVAAALVAAAAATAALGAGGAAYAGPAAGATVPVTPIALNSDWSPNAGSGSASPGFFIDNWPNTQVVYLQGAVKQVSTAGTTPDIIGVLPSYARPDRLVYELVHTFEGTYAEIEIDPFGNIILVPPHSPAVTDFSFVSLNGISYQRSPSAANFPVTLNSANWEGLTGATPSAYVDGSGIVHLQGAVIQTSGQGTGADVIGTLVPAFRPNFNVFTIVPTYAGTYADVWISAETGQITVIGTRPPAVSDDSFVSLEGITYTQDSGDVPIAVNTANFSGSTAFGTPRPAVLVDAIGVVHLSGAVAQTSAAGAGANLVGTVPADARPHHYVYELVHTYDGTYADVAITPAGQIEIIDPRSPMVTDLSFVSLSGINYKS
jgi:hypothetical protein